LPFASLMVGFGGPPAKTDTDANAIPSIRTVASMKDVFIT
jgi:hypothetical protein